MRAGQICFLQAALVKQLLRVFFRFRKSFVLQEFELSQLLSIPPLYDFSFFNRFSASELVLNFLGISLFLYRLLVFFPSLFACFFVGKLRLGVFSKGRVSQILFLFIQRSFFLKQVLLEQQLPVEIFGIAGLLSFSRDFALSNFLSDVYLFEVECVSFEKLRPLV